MTILKLSQSWETRVPMCSSPILILRYLIQNIIKFVSFSILGFFFNYCSTISVIDPGHVLQALLWRVDLLTSSYMFQCLVSYSFSEMNPLLESGKEASWSEDELCMCAPWQTATCFPSSLVFSVSRCSLMWCLGQSQSLWLQISDSETSILKIL